MKSFEDRFINHIIALARHLERDRTKNHLLQNVYDHEQKRIIRLGKEYEGLYHQEEQEEGLERWDKSIIKRVVDEMNKEKKDKWQEKVQHSYLLRKTKNNVDLDQKKSNIWLVNGKFSSHIEGYLFAIQEQEIETRILKKIRERDPLKEKKCQDSVGCVERLRKTFSMSLHHAPTCLVTCTYITDMTQWPKHCIKKSPQK